MEAPHDTYQSAPLVGAVDLREASRNAPPALYPTFGRYPDYTQQSKQRFYPQAAGGFGRAVPQMWAHRVPPFEWAPALVIRVYVSPAALRRHSQNRICSRVLS